MERKYSVSEIGQMRASVRASYGLQGNPSPAEIEDRLRTYMVAGTTPEELNEAFGQIYVTSSY